MAAAAQSYTVLLNSSKCDKVAEEHFVRTLDPPIDIPYLAQPRAQLEQLSFANTFSNVNAQLLKNKTEDFLAKGTILEGCRRP